MKLNRYSGDHGFTMIELIMVIVIVGILSSTAVPKFINLQAAAQKAACQANQGAINSAIAMQYAKQLLDDAGNADWLEELDSIDDVEDDWFATGAVPICRVYGSYVVSNGIARCSDAAHN